MMKMIVALSLLVHCVSALSAIKDAPPSFPFKGSLAVFIDFHKADYAITYDIKEQKVVVESLITFESKTAGYPIFDLIPDPLVASLDGVTVNIPAIRDPDLQTTLRVVEVKLSPGIHELKIKHSLTTNVIFDQRGVSSGFWMSDLNDRRYLEQYLPTNLEFDQYEMTSKIRIINGEGRPHLLKTNGSVTKISENHFEVIYPSFYSASSMFFHLFPENNSATNVQFYYPSIDGRLLPVDVYTIYNTDEFVAETKKILAELEADYGPFPHEQLIIYGNSLSGGMEYCGATSTSLKALGHELFHSYHARGLMPANGNAGWMDEAIARWRDNKYPLTEKLFFESTTLAGKSVWTRSTDRMAYTEGSAFLAWIAFRMKANGLDLKDFLKDYFEEYKYSSVTTKLFEQKLSEASKMDLSKDFLKYIYGKISTKNKSNPTHTIDKENPFHPNYTKEQLLELTHL